jgi:hypothetical protein
MILRELIAVDVALQGLFEVNQESSGALLPKDDEHQWVIQRLPDGYRVSFATHAAREVFPYLRQYVHTTSAQLDPANAILLQPPDNWEVLTPDGLMTSVQLGVSVPAGHPPPPPV